MNLKIEDRDDDYAQQCPHCGSIRVSYDAPNVFIGIGIIGLFPLGLLFLLLNKNRWCRSCRLRFKDA